MAQASGVLRNRYNNFWRAFVMLVCIAPINSIKFVYQIAGQQRQCFYEILSQNQKYSLQIAPKNHPRYSLEIAYKGRDKWQQIYYKVTQYSYDLIKIHKLAPSFSTYSFCITNQQAQILTAQIIFKFGVELMQFQFLADKTDTENIEREISWLEDNKKGLYDTIKQIQIQKIKIKDSSALLTTKMVFFALLGLAGVLATNLLFYREVKKILSKRKLI